MAENDHSWVQAVASLVQDRSPQRVIGMYEAGQATEGEIEEAIWRCSEDRVLINELLAQMGQSQLPWVTAMAGRLREWLHQDDTRVTDLHEIEQRSPLRSGIRVCLESGYDGAQAWWLNGRNEYAGTFLRFAPRRDGQMPIALIELDDCIDLTEARGLRHHGRYAVLRLAYVDDWSETGAVMLHVVDQIPDDMAHFCDSHPFGTEIESHASYRILSLYHSAGPIEEKATE